MTIGNWFPGYRKCCLLSIFIAYLDLISFWNNLRGFWDRNFMIKIMKQLHKEYPKVNFAEHPKEQYFIHFIDDANKSASASASVIMYEKLVGCINFELKWHQSIAWVQESQIEMGWLSLSLSTSDKFKKHRISVQKSQLQHFMRMKCGSPLNVSSKQSIDDFFSDYKHR